MTLGQLLLRRLKDSRGAALIEAAFVLPIFFLLMFTALEFGMIMFYSFVMESAMFDATRLAKVSDNTQQTVAAVRQAIQDRSFGLIRSNDIIITTELNVNFADNWQNQPAESCADSAGVVITGQFCPCPDRYIDTNNDGECDIGPPPLVLAAPGNLVNFTAFFKKQIYSPLTSFVAGTVSANEHLISAATVVRNEPTAPGG